MAHSVAQDAFKVQRFGDSAFEVTDGLKRPLEFSRRRRIQQIVFGLDRAPDAGEGPSAIALRDDLSRARLPRRGKEMVKALGAKPVGLRECAVEMAQVACIGERGHLVNYDFGSGTQHGLSQHRQVQGVYDNRTRSGAPQRLRLRRRTRKPGHAVTRRHEPGDQPDSDCPGCAGDQTRMSGFLLTTVDGPTPEPKRCSLSNLAPTRRGAK